MLIYEKYENEYGFVERDDMADPHVPTVERKADRRLRIFTWGLAEHERPDSKSTLT